MKTAANPELLFEIGVEEIPSGYFAHARASILAKAPALIAECGYQFDSLQVYTTPRRIALHAANFRAKPIEAEERLGPMKEQAYQGGLPTQALQGFLKNMNAKETDLFFKETPKGVRVGVKVRKDRLLLRYFFEALPKQIEFPKLMRWDETRYTFTRPIRWTFAFVGTKKQNYTIANVKSGATTYGHRFLSKGALKIKSAGLDEYKKLLARNHVILDAAERLRLIVCALKPIHNEDHELAETAAHLTEEPYAIRGSFDRSYLNLPREVLVTCMRKGQKTFAVYDAQGRLMNQFVAVINGKRKDLKIITANYERVLRSRLEDAQFFFREDTKTKLEAKVPKLKDTVFLGSLGSYYDRTKRLEAQVEFLAREAGFSDEAARAAKRAAHLAKADLATHLVYEFPELQGAAGSEYARLDQESEKVSHAILGQYLPRNLGENYRDLQKELSAEGALVGLADRMDLLVGALGLGIEPDSSQDPYALRRAAGSIVKILRAHPFRFSLAKWVRAAREQYGQLITKPAADFENKLAPFLKDRIQFELRVKPGSKEYELLRGIFASSCDDLANVYIRFDQLTVEIDHPAFMQACKVVERTSNILKGAKEKVEETISPEFFQDDLERQLFELVNRNSSALEQLVREERYREATRLYGETFYKPLHEFFDRVMVNAEDVKVRSNRRALMKRINRLFVERIADLALIQSERK